MPVGLGSGMAHERLIEEARRAVSPMRTLAEQAFSRTAGAPLVPGNSIRLLRDARENYPAWLEAMRSATQTIHFESFFIYDDDVGQQFAEVLIAKARQGVRVRLLYDWMGGVGKASSRFWRRLTAGGVEVRCFNPPRVDSPAPHLAAPNTLDVSVLDRGHARPTLSPLR